MMKRSSERRESLQNIVLAYFNAKIKIRNVLQQRERERERLQYIQLYIVCLSQVVYFNIEIRIPNVCTAYMLMIKRSSESGSDSSVGRRIGSDAVGLGFESQTGRVRGKSIISLPRDKHPAIKGLRPPEHHAGQFQPDQKDSSESEMNAL